MILFQALVCYDVQCNGKGCLPEAIIQAGTGVTTCATVGNQIYFVSTVHVYLYLKIIFCPFVIQQNIKEAYM